MATNDERVNLLISALVDGLENVASLTGELKELEEAGKEPIPDNTKDLREGTDKTSGSMESLRANIGKVVAVGASLGALAKYMKSSSTAALEAETRMLGLEQGIKATGRESEITAEELREMSRELAFGTLASTEEVEKGAAALMTFRNVGTESFGEVLELAQDLAQSGFGSLESNAKTLGKALEDPVKGMSQLSEQGVTFSEEQKEVNKALVESGQIATAQANILATVTEQVGGVGRAAAEGLEGSLDTLQQRWQELKEAQGDAINPALEEFYNSLSEALVYVTEHLDEIHTAAEAAGDVLLALGARKIITGIMGLATSLGGVSTSAAAAAASTKLLNAALKAAPWIAVTAATVEAGKALWDWKKASDQAAEAEERAAASAAALQERFVRLSEETGTAIVTLEDYTRAKREGIIVFDEATGKWIAAAEAERKLADETARAAAELERQTEWAERHSTAASEEAQQITAVGLATRDWVEALTAVDLEAKDAEAQITSLIASADMGDSTQMAGLLNALNEIAAETPELGELIRTELIGTIQELDSQSLATLSATLKSAFDDGTISAKQFADQSEAIVGTAAQRMGIDIEQALGKTTEATENALYDLEALASGLESTGYTAEEQGVVISRAFEKAFDSAKTTSDIDAITLKIEEMGQKGVLSAQQLETLKQATTAAMEGMADADQQAADGAEAAKDKQDGLNQSLRDTIQLTGQVGTGIDDLTDQEQSLGDQSEETAEKTEGLGGSLISLSDIADRAGLSLSDVGDHSVALTDQVNRAISDLNITGADTRDVMMEYEQALDAIQFQAAETASALVRLDRDMAALDEQTSSATRGVEQLELRLLEVNGTEEEIAEARLARDKAQIQVDIEKNRIEAERARLTGDTEAADRFEAENRALEKQLRLLDKIARAEDQQRREREEEDARREQERNQNKDDATRTTQSTETVKVVEVNINGTKVEVVEGYEDDLIEELERLQQVSS